MLKSTPPSRRLPRVEKLEYEGGNLTRGMSTLSKWMCRDEAVKQAEARTARAAQSEAAVARLTAQEAKQADLSSQLAAAVLHNKELAVQLQAVTDTSAKVCLIYHMHHS